MQQQPQQNAPANNKKKQLHQKLSFGRTAPLLARQRLLPMELHAKLMPFDRRRHAEIPDIEPPEIPSFKNRKLGQSASKPQQDDEGGSIWHSSKSISWSVRTADIANMLSEARQQREHKKQQRLDHNMSVTLSPSSSSPPPSALQSPSKQRASSHQRHHVSIHSPDASGDSPPRLPQSALMSPEKHSHHQKQQPQPQRGRSASCALLYEADNSKYSAIDPADVAMAIVKSKLQAQPTQMKRPLSASISGRGEHRPQEQHDAAADGQQQQQQQPTATESRPTSAIHRLSRPATASSSRSVVFANNNNNNNDHHHTNTSTAEADLMDAAWRLSSQPAPTYNTTGRGREAYPRYDDFGHEYRDDTDVAVEHAEGVGATVAGQAGSSMFRYHGTYVRNKKEGMGRYIVGEDGSSYLGEFKAGEMAGAGVRYLSDGTVLQGTFEEGELCGEECVVLAPSGERFEGGYKGGRRHGHGVLQWRSEANVPPPPPLTTATPAPPGGAMTVMSHAVVAAAAAEDADAGIIHDDDDGDEDGLHQVEEEFLYEQAFHKFVGQFVDGDPSGPGMQTTNKTRRDPASGEMKQQIVDTVQGTFSGSGPQGRCKRTITRTFFGEQPSLEEVQQQQQSSRPSSLLSARHRSSLLVGPGGVKKTVRREVFEGSYEAGREHGPACVFQSSTTGIDYCGPMRDGHRARVPNTIVLEGARVLPLENVSKHDAAAAAKADNGASAAEGGACGVPALPSGQVATTGSGRRNAPVTQDSVSWAQPLTATQGTEVIQLRLCTANLFGFAGDEQYTSLRLEQLQQHDHHDNDRRRQSCANMKQFSPLHNSAAHMDETGRRLTVKVYSADAKLGVPAAVRSMYHALGLDDLFLDAVVDSFDPELEGENVEFDIAASHALNKISGRKGAHPHHNRKSVTGGGGSAAAMAAAAAGRASGAAASGGGGGGGIDVFSLFTLHTRTLLPMCFDAHAARKHFIEAVKGHREILKKLSAPPPTAEEEAAAAEAARLTPRQKKKQQQQQQQQVAQGSPVSALRRPSSASSSGIVVGSPTAAQAALQNSPAAIAAQSGCTKEPLLQVSREHLANTTLLYQQHLEELVDITEDILLTAPGAPSNLNATAVNAAVADDIRREITPPAPAPGSPHNSPTAAEKKHHHGVPALGGQQQPHHQHGSLRNRIGIASRGAFVQSQTVTTTKGQAVATVQLAPMQAAPGDLLFIVVQFADDNIVLPSPGGDPIRFFHAPLVVPLVVGGKGTPRGRK